MLYITNHQGNANQNHNEISFSFVKKTIIKTKTKKETSIDKNVEKRQSLYTVGGNVNW